MFCKRVESILHSYKPEQFVYFSIPIFQLFLAPSVSDGASNGTLEFDGYRIPLTMSLPWKEVWVMFKTDGGGQKEGFLMEVTSSGKSCKSKEKKVK